MALQFTCLLQINASPATIQKCDCKCSDCHNNIYKSVQITPKAISSGSQIWNPMQQHSQSFLTCCLLCYQVKAERMKARGQEKLTNKLAATRRIAEEKRANAEAKLNEKALRTSEKADYIRRTGHLPSTFSFKLPSLCWQQYLQYM